MPSTIYHTRHSECIIKKTAKIHSHKTDEIYVYVSHPWSMFALFKGFPPAFNVMRM